ncbi:MEKHLA domain-containing protein [Calothrix sp. 336/3]|uniref:MEKHLA domain-containing protein n=1 Tax=Calothrix sp. 336/3 TaxID=1337936 RepID=UPI0004E30D00|nr:MEKHLA domain-containing protein [Calothrix sp. 336/3]AKG22736.1 MEKHLA domain-containing protein [Calothrix sp. 336/3]
MSNDNQLPWQQESIIIHTQRILKSHQHWLGYPLLDCHGSLEDIAYQLFTANFVVISHGTESDPIFNYGNQKALDVLELSWQELIQTPSRKSAEAGEQQERNKLIASAASSGIRKWSGVRISQTGKRFAIQEAVIFNVLDEEMQCSGQVCCFDNYECLNN